MSIMSRRGNATLADLARVDGKAELIGGRIVHLMPTGHRPNVIAGEIFVSLRQHARAVGHGLVYTDNMGFVVPELPSGRETFSPDVAYFEGSPPSDEMDFVEGSPTFAVEVRSKNDYGPSAEREMAAKRADYFQAGTLVVWDVDPRDGQVACYRADAIDQPTVHRKGEAADAEPAVPGWRMAVDAIFG